MYFLSKSLDKLRVSARSVFTGRCPVCGEPTKGAALCQSCESALEPARKFSGSGEFLFSKAAAKYRYSESAKKALLGYKFSDDFRPFADIIFSWLLSAFDENFADENIDLIIPVPSYSEKVTRLSLLAKRLACYREIPFAPGLLVKTRRTEKQHTLSMCLRRTNLSGAFSADGVSGKSVLLVDDVFTSGSTANECAKALLASGAARVMVLTVLRTEFDDI